METSERVFAVRGYVDSQNGVGEQIRTKSAGWALALEQVIGGDEPGVDDLGNVSL